MKDYFEALALTGILLVTVIFIGLGILMVEDVNQKMAALDALANSTNNTHGLDIVEFPYGNGTVSCVHESGWFTSQLDCDWRPVK